MQTAIEKWEEVEGELLKEAVHFWHGTYWDKCEYCESYNNNEINCPLLEDREKLPVCYCNSEVSPSHASLCLLEADGRQYDTALYHCRIVLTRLRALEETK